MPKIDIKEQDLTLAGGLNASSNVVYVPGFVANIKDKYSEELNENKDDSSKPIQFLRIFRTVAEFKEVFSDANGDFKYVRIGEKTEDNTNSKLVTVERGTQYALTLLQLGLPILFDCVGVKNSTTTIYDESNLISELKDRVTKSLEKIKNKNSYDVTFITTGGYANTSSTTSSSLTTGLASTMLLTAATRNDCTALIDHLEEESKGATIYGIGNDGKYTITNYGDNGKYGALFTPWCTFQLPSFENFKEETTTVLVTKTTGINGETTTSPELKTYKVSLNLMNMPGSLAYLMAYASSINVGNANWLAIAGASRGAVPYLIEPLVELTEAHINKYALSDINYMGTAINPITKINPYGNIIWGNRTLNNNATGLVASSFLNIRQLCTSIKKTLYIACKGITFEQNSDILWVKFRSLITPLLDQMQTSDGISGYELKKKKTTKKATLVVVLRIYPIEAVEDFEITLELADESTNLVDSL